jgi:hypothetical protein
LTLIIATPDRIEAESPISQAAAYAIVASVPLLGTFSFFWPNVSDVALIALVLTSCWLLWHDRAQWMTLPVAMALAWMAFVAFSAAWATYGGIPGSPFRSWPKHIPIALGPLIAIVFAVACRRLRWSTDRLLALFLAGLISGALVLLIRNGAIGMIVELRPEAGALGDINRNLAALACSLAIVASVGLIDYCLFRLRIPRWGRWASASSFFLVLLGLLLLLALLRSRGGYIGTTAGLIAFVIALSVSAWRSQKENVGLQLRFAALLLASIALMFAAFNIFMINGHTLVAVPTEVGAQLLPQLSLGRGGYLAIPIVLIAAASALALPTWPQQAEERTKKLRIIAILLSIVALIVADFGLLTVSGRSLIQASAEAAGTSADTKQLLGLLVHGQFDQAHAIAKSGEERIQLLTFAADLFHRRPWLGWGPDVWLLARNYSPFPSLVDFNQFHNGYAQFLVSFGGLGVVVLGTYLATLIRAAWPRQRAPAMSASMLAAAVALLVTLLVINISESVLMVKCAANSAMMLAAMACLRSQPYESSRQPDEPPATDKAV